jgi:murein DD-endopeptidase MepM/ murein hydrolase activator NlpD
MPTAPVLTIIDQHLSYPIGFPAAEGTPIHAARGGRVVHVEQRFHLGGTHDQNYFGSRSNQIVIQHPDGTYANYSHLRHRGAAAEMGQIIERGDLIGYVGSTGVSSRPHLHFAVTHPFVNGAVQRLVIRFRVRESKTPVELREGKVFTVSK